MDKQTAAAIIERDLSSSGFGTCYNLDGNVLVYLTNRSISLTEVEIALLCMHYDNYQFELEKATLGRVIVKALT